VERNQVISTTGYSNNQPRFEINQSPVRQAQSSTVVRRAHHPDRSTQRLSTGEDRGEAHSKSGPELLKGKKFSLLSIRALQSPLRSVYQPHTFSSVAS